MVDDRSVPDEGMVDSSIATERRGRWAALWQSKYSVPLCLVLILLIGAVFRFTGVNWDAQTHLHPDERFMWMVEMAISLPKSVGEYFNTAQSPLNPYNQGSSFVYGTLPLFLTKFLGVLLKLDDGQHIHLLGRVLAGTFDLLTVLLMFAIGRKLYDTRVGLLASFLSACLVMNIQQAHFFTVDSFTATFVALTFYLSLRVVERGRWRDFLLMGLSYGLAIACKINVATVGLVMALACVLRILKALRVPDAEAERSDGLLKWEKMVGGVNIALHVEPLAETGAKAEDAVQSGERHWLDIGYSVALKLVVALVVAFLAFRIAQPYTFQGPGFFDLRLSERWLKDMRWVSELISGKVDYFPSHQWTSRPPVIFSLVNMVLWMVGVPLGLTSWAGWAFAWYELWRKRKLQHLLILAWTTFFFFYQSTRFVKNSRYLVPFYPFMAVLAAYLLVHLWDRAKSAKVRWAKSAALALAVVVTVGTFLWAFAFTRIYTRPLTRVAASLWVYDNIPPGSTIGWEEWDDIIPWGGVGGRNGYAEGIYSDVKFQPYHEDVPEKLDWFIDWLNRADYIILSSNRLYGSIPRLPMRYPMTTRYYKYLFSGELGFELIKTFTSHPNLGPIEINDDNAEEVFTVYDHPKVLIFKKTARYSPEKARKLLGEGIDWDSIARLKPIEVPKWKNGLQMTEKEKEIQRSGGTWSAIFNRNSLSNALPVLIWLLLVEVLGAVTLPLTGLIFQGMADRGYALSKSLGILLLTWLTWMLVNLGLTGYSRMAISVSLLLLTGFSAAIFWRRREQIVSFWREHRHLIVVNEVLFLFFFAFFLLIRYGNPDLWHPVMGGEKPMDFAYLNAVIKSSIFPPYDPWFAGGYLNYYYFGQIIVATLIKFTGIVPWVAYNLAIPLFAALTAMGAFCVVYNLTTREPSSDVASSPMPGRLNSVLGDWWRPELLWGLLAALFVAVLGNLGEIGVLLKALRDMGTVQAQSSIRLLADLAKVLSGAYHWLLGQGKPAFRPEWWYWNASRIMPNGEINEFPFFTFLYADLHAHLIALPFTLLALGMAVNVIRQKGQSILLGQAVRRGQGDAPGWLEQVKQVLGGVNWGEALLLASMALAVGALRCINSWDYPTYLLVACVALALREYEHRGRVDRDGLWALAWRAGAVLLLSNVFFWPFLSRFATAYVSFERWKGPRTGLDAYLVIHGLFLWIIVSLMGFRLFGREARQVATRMLRLAVRYWDRLPRLFALYRCLVHEGREFDGLGATVTAALVLLLTWLVKSKEWFYIFVLLLILGTLLIVLRWRMEPKRRFLWLLFGIGLALSLGVDLVVLKGDIGRMNTVFKFYLQIWVMWSVVAAVSLSYLVELLRQWSEPRRRLWWGVFALLFVLASLYPVLATRAKINDRFDRQVGPTLDGMAYMKRAVYHDSVPIELKWDYQAINWLLDNAQGSPVIAEANTEPWLYRWGSRVSIYTGLPTIIGWSWHQRQQRSALPGEWIDRRINDVRALYSDPSPDVALDILHKYEVRYIYLGDVERIYYPGSGLNKFEAMCDQGSLKLVYHNERVSIYEVVR